MDIFPMEYAAAKALTFYATTPTSSVLNTIQKTLQRCVRSKLCCKQKDCDSFREMVRNRVNAESVEPTWTTISKKERERMNGPPWQARNLLRLSLGGLLPLSGAGRVHS